MRGVVLITGVMAAGKSAVAQALALGVPHAHEAVGEAASCGARPWGRLPADDRVRM